MNQDQQKILEDAKKKAKEFAYFMRKELEIANLRGALKYSAEMLEELKTSALSPKNYYALWMAIFTEMREMEKYFKEEAKRGRKMKELYASVQQSPSLIPRLYLLITVASVYIQSHEQGSKLILTDIIEMLRGVQNPLRGLYTRYYFLKICKDRLPDAGSEYEEQGYGINEAFDIIYTNLRQSVSLWIRLSLGKDKIKKQRERNELKMLIGENLSRLSSLEGLTLQVYIDLVLPKLMELVITSKDAMAQQYILDCIIQGFPEEFHIKTLSELLGLCANQLEKQVNVKNVFISLMDRLSDYAMTAQATSSQNIYQLFKENILVLIDKSDSMQFKNVIKLESSFLKFTVKCYPKNVPYVNEILSLAVTTCQKNGSDYDDEAQKIITEFLTLPLQTISVDILTMPEYLNLMKCLKFVKRREVALKIVNTVDKLKLQLIDQTLVGNLLKFIDPLLRTGSDFVETTPLLFTQEQTLVSKLVFLVHSQSVQQVWTILKSIIDEFKKGGSTRLIYTYPSTLFRLFEFAKQVSKGENSSKVFKKIFSLSKQLIQQIAKIQPLKGLLLYLQFSLVINLLDKNQTFDEFTYQTLTDALQLYEAQSTDPEIKARYLKIIIASVQQLECLSDQNYSNIADNVTGFASKILKKNEQAIMLLQCLPLYNNNKHKTPERINQIFRKCNKLANTCYSSSPKNLYIFVDIINKYAYFNIQGLQFQQELQLAIQYFTDKYGEFEKEASGDLAIQSYIGFWNRTKTYLNSKINEGVLKIQPVE